MPSYSLAEHRQYLAELLAGLPQRTAKVGLRRARGSVVATNIYSPTDLPAFRNSAMDGYAVSASAVGSVPIRLPVVGTIAAGDPHTEPLPTGSTAKIMTGAALPAGADCVVPVEHTDGDDGAEVTIRVGRNAGDYVREPGTDVRRGELLLAAGTELTPRHVAALAAAGIEAPEVRLGARVAVITTGNELLSAGKPLGPGQIYDSNGISLAVLSEAEHAEAAYVGHSSDDLTEFRHVLGRAIEVADLVFTCGGISMGDFEVVRQVLEPLGGHFGHLAIQPGGPQGITVVDGVPVLSFPGNPVSCAVSFELFARSALREVAGLPPVEADVATVSVELRSPEGRRQFLPGRRRAGAVEPVSGPGSHLVAGMAGADVLIEIPEDVTVVAAGAEVRVRPL